MENSAPKKENEKKAISRAQTRFCLIRKNNKIVLRNVNFINCKTKALPKTIPITLATITNNRTLKKIRYRGGAYMVFMININKHVTQI
ncbi:hypothetical protein GCM10022395_27670 [Snuella lapsa]|uniref:Uncharacterized protein n=1 Tax=Snuella lapsa TaxID=870481 RepID=A0ABP6Y4P6_9FLAO